LPQAIGHGAEGSLRRRIAGQAHEHGDEKQAENATKDPDENPRPASPPRQRRVVTDLACGLTELNDAASIVVFE
jgi:hypothetical protein